MSTARQPKGIPVGGQFAAASHGDSGLTLTAPRPVELDQYGPIPAPREGQAFADGSPVHGGTFEDAYREFFRPLDEHEAVHGQFSREQGPSEGEMLKMAGLQDVDLGRYKGATFEADEFTGEPIVSVHTRNGGYNAYCYEDNCAGNCHGCIQSDVIPNLPTFIRSEHDSGDSYNYFRPVDPEAARAVLAAQKHQEGLGLRSYLRTAIREGRAAPWEILEQVHGENVPWQLLSRRDQALKDERNHQRYADMAPAVLEAVQAGTKAPTSVPMMRGPAGQFKYDCAVATRDQAQATAAQARQAEATLQAELSTPLPPAVKALATAEVERLSTEAAKAEEWVAKETEKIAALAPHLTAWAERTLQESAEYAAKSKAATAAVEQFNWARSWPGELQDCPPKPAPE